MPDAKDLEIAALQQTVERLQAENEELSGTVRKWTRDLVEMRNYAGAARDTAVHMERQRDEAVVELEAKDAEIARLRELFRCLVSETTGTGDKSVKVTLQRLGIPEEDPEVLRARDSMRG